MTPFWRSTAIAICIAAAVQCFFVGVLAKKLPREVCRPGVQIQRTLSLPARPAFSLDNADGSVHVRTHPAQEFAITAEVRAYTTQSDATPVAEQYVNTLITTEISEAQLAVITEPGERPEGIDLRVDYVVLVPEGTRVSLRGSGNVSVNGPCGAVDVEGNTGDIDVAGAQGPLRVRSNIGRIQVQGTPSDADLETVNGNIYATIAAGDLRARSTNGTIYATLSGSDIQRCDLNSLNGGITLNVSEGCSADVHAASSQGSVYADAAAGFTAAVQKQREFVGRSGTGDGEFTLQTLNGNINIWLARSGT